MGTLAERAERLSRLIGGDPVVANHVEGYVKLTAAQVDKLFEVMDAEAAEEFHRGWREGFTSGGRTLARRLGAPYRPEDAPPGH